MEKTTELLKNVWAEFRQENPKTRIREAAYILGVSEVELLATGTGETVTRLEGDFRELLKRVGTLGRVMALTRNRFCVHERKGLYENLSFSSHVGLVLGSAIDLRLFMSKWKYGYAVEENERRSLQFFNKEGIAVHKIYLTEKSNHNAYEKLVKQFKVAEQQEPLSIGPDKQAPRQETTEDIDQPAFQKAWLELKDTHDFSGLLRKFKLNREKAMHLAPEGHTRKVNLAAIKAIFAKAAERDLPIMVFTGSPACIQIHTGPVKRLVQTGPWFNVLDPDFNLHLKDDGIASVWVVKKPTTDGIVTGVEVFDEQGELIVQLFGKRKPGIPEDERWRDLLASIPGIDFSF